MPTRPATVLVLFAMAFLASGCTGTWTGKGREVAKAIEQSSKTQSARFEASMQFSVTGVPGQAAAPQEIAITMSGKADIADPAHPKFAMTMRGPGASVKIVEPGDGRTYVTSRGRAVSYPEEKADESETARILTALGASVGGFRQSQPMTNTEGESVPAIYAEVDKDKLCSSVVAAFGDAFANSSSTGEWSKTFGGDPAEGMAGMCKRLVKKNPGIWFGIRDGILTDLAMTANLALPMGAVVSMTVQYHEFDQDENVGSFKVPPNATAVASQAEAQALVN